MNIIHHQPQILLLPTCKGIAVINTHEIVRIEAMSNYSKLYFTNKKTLVVAKVLRWFEERLVTPLPAAGWPDEAFLRIHRKHLINKNFINQYVNGKGGKIELDTGEWFDVSKRKKSIFLKHWYIIAA
jgi:two-component system, LytTR family, response regulator